MLLPVLSWNLFHGRDAPPDASLQVTAWRLSRRPLDDGVFLGVNRSLQREFMRVICASEWSVCLLQEAPPAWSQPLGERCGADWFRVATSRNQLGPLSRLVARWRPDLLGSWEGGSNATLARGGWTMINGTRRSLLLSSFRERGFRERRRMAFVRLGHPSGAELCVANLHAATRPRDATERELRRAADAATTWAGDTPLLLGGDFNVRPRDSGIFDELARDFSLSRATAPDAIDHLLARRLEIESPPRRWPAGRRDVELAWRGRRRLVRLSDHAPLEAVFRLGETG